MRQMAQVQHVAKHARHKEEWRTMPAFALMHRHQMGEPALWAHLCFRRSVPSRLTPQRRVTHPLRNHRGARFNGGRLKQHRNREFNRPGLFDHGKQAHRDQAVPAEVKEAVADANLLHTQQILPKACQSTLNIGFWCHKIGFQLRPFKALAWPVVFFRARLGLRNQRGQIKRRDHHLRPVPAQRCLKQIGPHLRWNALGQIVRQPFFGGGQRGLRLCVLVKGDFRLAQRLRLGKARRGFHLP
mmetsp:Transcript_9431/g.15656  ORF Transcript_9431/g.15656 Transcript_9431/m.15656 type:complete len:242 (-) Transcript_9431:11-736(-)